MVRRAARPRVRPAHVGHDGPPEDRAAHACERHLSQHSGSRTTCAWTRGTSCLNVMPLFHGHGLIGALLATVAAGGSIVCTPGFDHQSFFRWIAQFEPTWYTAVPTIHQWVVANRGQYRQAAPAHGFRFVRSCSAALPSKTFEALQALTGSPVIEAYGMTEASHQIASNPLSGPPQGGLGRTSGGSRSRARGRAQAASSLRASRARRARSSYAAAV